MDVADTVAVRLDAQKAPLVGREDDVHAPRACQLADLVLHAQAVALLDEEIETVEEVVRRLGRDSIRKAAHLEVGVDARDPTAAAGFVNAMSDLPKDTGKGGTLYVFALP